MDLGVRREIEKVGARLITGVSHDGDLAAALGSAHYHLLWDFAHHLLAHASLGRSGNRDIARGHRG